MVPIILKKVLGGMEILTIWDKKTKQINFLDCLR